MLGLRFGGGVWQGVSALVFCTSGEGVAPLFLVPRGTPGPREYGALGIQSFKIVVLFLGGRRGGVDVLRTQLFGYEGGGLCAMS